MSQKGRPPNGAAAERGCARSCSTGRAPGRVTHNPHRSSSLRWGPRSVALALRPKLTNFRRPAADAGRRSGRRSREQASPTPPPRGGQMRSFPLRNRENKTPIFKFFPSRGGVGLRARGARCLSVRWVFLKGARGGRRPAPPGEHRDPGPARESRRATSYMLHVNLWFFKRLSRVFGDEMVATFLPPPPGPPRDPQTPRSGIPGRVVAAAGRRHQDVPAAERMSRPPKGCPGRRRGVPAAEGVPRPVPWNPHGGPLRVPVRPTAPH